MKLIKTQVCELIRMSGYLEKILLSELKCFGKIKEEYENDDIYNAILSAIGGIEQALELNESL